MSWKYVQYDGGKYRTTDSGGGGGNVNDVNVNGVSVVDANKVAQITSYKEVTQAQYDALPATKTSDGVMYCITDAQGGASGHNYSTNEQVVGTWIDGKPLYEKTITGTFASNSSTILSILMASNMGIIVNVRGFLVPSDNPTHITSLECKNDYAWIDAFTSANGYVTIKRGGSGYFGDTPSVYITACYTKITD